MLTKNLVVIQFYLALPPNLIVFFSIWYLFPSFEFLTVVLLKIKVFSNVTLCRLVNTDRCFKGK